MKTNLTNMKKEFALFAVLAVILGVAVTIPVLATDNLEIYGWAFNVTNPNNLSSATVVYNYTIFLENYTINESNLDLYEYNWEGPTPTWERTYATLDTNENTLTLEVTEFPKILVLGESIN